MDRRTDDEKQIINLPPPPFSFSITCSNSLSCRSFLNLVLQFGTMKDTRTSLGRLHISLSQEAVLVYCPITIHRCPLHCIQFKFVTFQLSNHFHSQLAITFTRNHFIFHCINLRDGFSHIGATERLCCYLQKNHKDTRTK